MKNVSKQVRLKEPNQNYDINDLKSEDETDDEEMPSKPVPVWASELNLKPTAIRQAHKFINFTQLFRGSLREDVNLDEVFKIKKKNFTVRTSSANWNSPPVWNKKWNKSCIYFVNCGQLIVKYFVNTLFY